MTLKLFQGASNDLTQCFKLLEHPYLSCRSGQTFALALVASLLLDACQAEALKGFEISSSFFAQNRGHVDAEIFSVFEL